METLQLFQVSPVQGPCLTTIQGAGENDRPVHLELRGPPDAVLAQDASLQAYEVVYNISYHRRSMCSD